MILRFAALLAAVVLAESTVDLALAADADSSLSTTIESAEDLVSAYAVVLHPSATEESAKSDPNAPIIDPQKPGAVIRPAQVERTGDTTWKIETALKENDHVPNTRVTFVAMGKNGSIVPGPMIWISGPSEAEPADEVICQERPDADQINRLLTLEKSALSTLIEVRKTRAEVLKESLKTRMTPSVIARLQSYEQQLGLTTTPPLSASLSVDELARRVALIQSVLKNQ